MCGMWIVFGLTGCGNLLELAVELSENANSGSSTGSGTDSKAGPVEHIDADERRQAALLMPTLGPVQKEIRMFRADVRSAFESGEFDKLERMAEGLIAEGDEALFANGSWKIAQFYNGLSDRFSDSEDQFLTDLERHRRWRKEMPESTVAKIAYGDFLTQYAWFARGGGYANTVTNRGWRLFRTRLAEARDLLMPLMGEELKDPYWGMVMLWVALGQGWSETDYSKLINDLKRLAPTFWGYDLQRAYSLLPRWHGEKGDWVRYAAWAADRPDGLGDEVYARVVIRMVGFYGSVYRETSADWERTRSGLKILLEKYPKSLSLANSAARVAVVGDDREMAAELFKQIGEKYVEDCWINPEQFVHYRTWARTGKW